MLAHLTTVLLIAGGHADAVVRFKEGGLSSHGKQMINQSITSIFEKMAGVIAFKGEKRFHALAYERAARHCINSNVRPNGRPKGEMSWQTQQPFS